MSYRPTVSVYFHRHIVDIGYYRNWEDKDLFFEAIAIAALYGDCDSAAEYRERKYGHQRVYRCIEPVIIEDTEENRMELERCSEFPVIVDITAKCIYSNYGALTWKELSKLPSILDIYESYGTRRTSGKAVEPVRFSRISEFTDFSFFLENCRIPFGHLDFEEIKEILLNWENASYHLSKNVMEHLNSIGNVQAKCKNGVVIVDW